MPRRPGAQAPAGGTAPGLRLVGPGTTGSSGESPGAGPVAGGAGPAAAAFTGKLGSAAAATSLAAWLAGADRDRPAAGR